MQFRIGSDPARISGTAGGSSRGSFLDTSRYSWLELSWSVILVVLPLLAGMVVVSHTKLPTLDAVAGKMRGFLSSSRAAAAPERALVITANPDRAMQVAATLSPRGYEALPAKTLGQVRRLLAGGQSAPRFAVLDAGVGDAKAIVALLKQRLPASRIVILEPSTPRGAIGQMLLDRM